MNPNLTLAEYLRQKQGLTGTKVGCGEGGCGSCAVVLSRWDAEKKRQIIRSVNSCLRPLAACHGWAITTVEGLRRRDSVPAVGDDATKAETLHPIPRRLAQLNGLQCGFCSPGMIMTMFAALRRNPDVKMADMEAQFDGNICRCTGYRPILDCAKSFASDSNVVDHINARKIPPGGYDRKRWDYMFPEDLKQSEMPNYKLRFQQDGLLWLKPKRSLKSLMELVSRHPQAHLCVGGTAVGIYKAQPLRDPSELTRADDNGDAASGTKKVNLWNILSEDQQSQSDIASAAGGGADGRSAPSSDAKIETADTTTSGAGLSGATSASDKSTGAISAPSVKIDASDVPEMLIIAESRVDKRQGLEVGAAITIDVFHGALIDWSRAGKAPSFKVLAAHLLKIANVHVRRAGSIGGNLIMAKRYGFLSDLATILLGAGAVVTWVGAARSVRGGSRRGSIGIGLFSSMRTWTQTIEDFLSTPEMPPGAVVLSVHIPFPRQDTVLKTYRAAIRPLNSHAIVNAAFSARLETKGEGSVITDAIAAYGGLMNHEGPGAHAIRMPVLEKALNGQQLNNDVFDKARAALRDEAKAIVSKAGGMRADTRLALADAFLVRFLLSLPGAPERVKGSVRGSRDGISAVWSAVSESRQDYTFPNTHAPVSAPVRKKCGRLLASGKARFTDDRKAPHGALYACLVPARRARAEVKAIDVSAARNTPGYVGFVGASETLALEGLTNSFSPMGEPYPLPRHLFFLYGTPYVFLPIGNVSSYHGQPVGLVLADTPLHAREAARRVRIVFGHAKPVILGVHDSAEQKQFIPDMSSSGLPTVAQHTVGDAKHVLEEAAAGDHGRASGRLSTGSQLHFFMEPTCVDAIPEDDGGMSVALPAQWPQGVNEVVARVLGVPQHAVNVTINRAGGSFGGRALVAGLFAAAASLAAKKHGRPVRLHVDRNTEMSITGGRCEMEVDYEVAYDKKTGQLKALRTNTTCNAGHSVGIAWFTNMSVASALSQAYRIPALKTDSRTALTNTAVRNVMRGPGEIQASITMETILEHVAHDCRLPTHEVRKRNLHAGGQDFKVPNGKTVRAASYTVPKMWESLEKKSEYSRRAAAIAEFNKTNRLKKRGIAMTPVRYEVNVFKRSAIVNVYPDGSILVHHGGCDMGQGINIKVAQVVAHQLGTLLGEPLDMDLVRFGRMSTGVLPSQTFTGGSTTSEGAAEAARRACEVMVARFKPVLAALREKAAAKAAEERKKMASEEAKGGENNDNGSPEGGTAAAAATLTWNTLCAAAEGANVHMQATGHWDDTKDENKANYMCWGVGCSEVELDVLTGETAVIRVDLVYDAAKSLNPAIDIGQAEGAFMQGLGFVLQEQVLYDKWNGELISNGTWEYKPPLAVNVPRQFSVYLHSGNTTGRILSSKASGEPPLVLATSVFAALRGAIASARFDVGEKAFFEMPVPCTIESVLRLVAPARELLRVPYVEK